MNLKFSLLKMTEADAREILSWRYEAPYDFYDPAVDEIEQSVETLTKPTNLYLSIQDGNDQLIGYYCFGVEAQIPGGDYSENAFDFGGF